MFVKADGFERIKNRIQNDQKNPFQSEKNAKWQGKDAA